MRSALLISDRHSSFLWSGGFRIQIEVGVHFFGQEKLDRRDYLDYLKLLAKSGDNRPGVFRIQIEAGVHFFGQGKLGRRNYLDYLKLLSKSGDNLVP